MSGQTLELPLAFLAMMALLRSSRVGLGIFTAWLMTSSVAWADRVWVFPSTGSGVAESDLVTTRELVRGAVVDAGETVVDDAAQSDFSLKPKLLKLGSSYLLSVEKIKNGQVVHASQLKAANIEELDRVAQRVTASVLDSKNAKTDLKVGEVTDHEATQGTQRRPTRYIRHIQIGPGLMHGAGNTGVAYVLGGGFGWDLNRFAIKVGGDLGISGSALQASASLGALVFLTLSDIAPYVGGDFGVGAVKGADASLFSGESLVGFLGAVQGGIAFFRTAGVNLDLQARYSLVARQGTDGLPGMFAVRLGLVF